jgi:hypothetical protein
MKRIYVNPLMRVVKIEYQNHLLDVSKVQQVSGNADIEYGGGSNVDARSRHIDNWDE